MSRGKVFWCSQSCIYIYIFFFPCQTEASSRSASSLSTWSASSARSPKESSGAVFILSRRSSHQLQNLSIEMLMR